MHPSYYISDADIPYEEDLQRNPFSMRSWLRYVEVKAQSAPIVRVFLYERALLELPGSYKLWKAYLDYRVSLTEPRGMERNWKALNELYERALVYLKKMPRIWLDYCALLMAQKRITLARRAFDRALRALPVGQHHRIWELYFRFVKSLPESSTALLIYRRYVQFDRSFMEEYIDILLELGRVEEAVQKLVQLLSAPYVSPRGTTMEQLWKKLIEVLAESGLTFQHSLYSFTSEACRYPVEAVLRSGMAKLKDQLGWVWACLANYFVRLGLFEKARDIYEEGLCSVTMVRDFGQIFDAYAKFEESMVAAQLGLFERLRLKLKSSQASRQAGKKEKSGDDLASRLADVNLDVDLRLARFEALMHRRPFLLSDIMLKQNSNNVLEWEKRIDLYKGNHEKIVETFTNALTTIQPRKAVGKSLSELWIRFARYYESIDKAQTRIIFEKAIQVPFKSLQELVAVWLAYADCEKQCGGAMKALELLARATKPCKRSRISVREEHESVQGRLFKSIQLWSHVVELEKSMESLARVRAAYDRILELRIATPQIIFAYADYLEKHAYFEDAFKVYERGVDLFGYPIAFDIWNLYLSKFVARYQGKKLERARDLFEQAIENVPAKYAKPIYIMYGELEEKHGLARNAMKIYDRATRAVAPEERRDMYLFYVSKASQTFGITAAREIFEAAIEALPAKEAKDMCTKYAELETKLGEIERARAIYAHGSGACDPRIVPNYWSQWQDFEIKHGNETSFREMLRIKRSVQAQYHSDLPFISAGVAQPAAKKHVGGDEEIQLD